jgi:F0F1-type ATP synthase epsilon subunit
MELLIVSPLEKEIVDVTWLEIHTHQGSCIIQEGHAPMMVTLAPKSDLTYSLPDGTQRKRTISWGIAHITRATITLILPS